MAPFFHRRCGRPVLLTSSSRTHVSPVPPTCNLDDAYGIVSARYSASWCAIDTHQARIALRGRKYSHLPFAQILMRSCFSLVGRLQFGRPCGALHVGLSHQDENAKLPAFRNLRFAAAHAVRLLESLSSSTVSCRLAGAAFPELDFRFVLAAAIRSRVCFFRIGKNAISIPVGLGISLQSLLAQGRLFSIRDDTIFVSVGLRKSLRICFFISSFASHT